MATIYQHGTLELIMSGLYDGTTTFSSLLQYGSTGIGTMNQLDGEVTILNNRIFQTNTDGRTHEITNLDLTTPFTSIHDQSKLYYFLQEKFLDFNSLNQLSQNKQNWHNLPASIQIKGDFSKLKVRVAPKQKKPYPPFIEVTRNQPEFEYKNVSGTLVGDFGPELYSGIMANGWHLHFLSDDYLIGGHVLDFSVHEMIGRVDFFEELNNTLPNHNEDFKNHQADILKLRDAIDLAEK